MQEVERGKSAWIVSVTQLELGNKMILVRYLGMFLQLDNRNSFTRTTIKLYLHDLRLGKDIVKRPVCKTD